MSELGAILCAWAAVHAYVGIHYGSLYLRQRRSTEHLWFVIISFALSLYTIGSSQIVDADTLIESVRARQVQWIGGSVGVAAATAFIHQLLGKPHARVVTAATVWVGVGLVFDFGGYLFEPKPTPPTTLTLLWFAPEFPEARMTALAWVFAAIGAALAGHSLFSLAQRARSDPDLRPIVFATCPAIVAGVHDLALRFSAWHSLYLTEHIVLLSSVAVSYMLTRRFVRLADELTARTHELAESYEELHHMQEELVRKEQLAAVGELSAVIAHEVRNPLAVLRNATSGLRSSSMALEDRCTLLSILDDEVSRLNRLVRDLLTYAKPVSPQVARLSLRTVVEHAVELARRAHPRNEDVAIELDLDGGPAEIQADRDLVERALINVIENAMEAMGGAGCVTLRARPIRMEDGTQGVALSCHDTGEGMDTLVRNKARDPFFTTRPSGTGLGLAIVERVARVHRGRIDIQSSQQSGTTVTMKLPVLQPSVSSPSRAASEV